MNKLHILIVEDGKSQREMLRDFLAKEGHVVAEAENGEIAISKVLEGYFDLLLLDYKMPKMNGMEVLKKVKSINPEIDVVMMTAYGTIETAVEAMKAGALDYIAKKPIDLDDLNNISPRNGQPLDYIARKPIDLDELNITINRISERQTLIRENKILRQELRDKGVTTDKIIYGSPEMENLINMAGRVASSRATVLIQGESGTGKELFARLIHNLSPRSEKPMIAINCGALPENLLESELFGYEKGAFTGANTRRIGRFEEADGGTIFLDEIGEMSLSVQVKLLRFLQEHEFQRLGGNRTIHSDIRIISATNQDLETKVKEGTFREDLLYRINVVVMSIPPLGERREDIPLLIEHFLRRFAAENGKNIENLSSEAKDLLLKYEYPGNVRELENIIERAVVISREPVITMEELSFYSTDGQKKLKESRDARDALLVKGKKSLPSSKKLKESREARDALERQMIQEAMEETNHHQTKAAAILGISERMLRYRLKKYALKQN